MHINLVGLGRMGLNLALRMKDVGVEVVAWNRSEDRRVEARRVGIKVVDEIDEFDFESAAGEPLIFWLMVDHFAVPEVLYGGQYLAAKLPAGAIVIDGANAKYTSSQEIGNKLQEQDVHYLDLGVSGGIEGARNGPCLMCGGAAEIFDQVEPLLRRIATPSGLAYMGTSGAGHYAKMVHNAIEYGMLQSFAEGLSLLEKSPFGIDPAKFLDTMNHGSIIKSEIAKFILKAFQADPDLANTSSQVGMKGTAHWAIEEADKLGVDLDTVNQAIQARMSNDPNSEFMRKIIQGARQQFGGHDVQQQPQL